MANSPQARKRTRQRKKRELHNASQRSAVRTVIKKTLKSLQTNDRQAAQIAFQKAIRILDKAAARRTIHLNKAARLKSRLNQKLKSLT
ncbi:MAG: 30S ribosomal protein S20 [Coxiella-like endosymbiont]|uniref:30S ribosomal protein S20 n=1 Tax=Coxiella-like endosymbiont TaxID=1592897 RepID=UPI00215B5DEF|nr:30S ribosomal protein S20 [Coxiella-like endosymbiont]UVE59605.1 30S ribosomal protein S20 [Coxiella-like endosymbiont]